MADLQPPAVAEEPTEDLYLSPPVQRAARLLRHIAEGDAITNMSRTARELGINRTTLLRLLHTLEAERFIEPQPNGQGWRIGVGLIGLTAQAFFSEDLVQTSVPVLTRLADTLSLSAHLGVLDGLEIVYLVRRVPNHRYASNIRIGSRLPAHAANMGRIILAYLPPERVDRLYAGSVLKAVTSHTAVTPAQLHAQLDADRACGLAWSDGNFEAGISSVAAAIFDVTGLPVAALNVSGHPADFAGAARRGQIATEVQAAAFEISQRLGWRNTPPRQSLTDHQSADGAQAVARASS
ncbi:MAG: helix-turn-helix domain-containing protein [Rhodopseudomonas sp.]|nr:helix-turn-helix domain-containing protein [Rhodopseudomonas sp.]